MSDECERDENGNYLDIITYNVIPPGRLLRIPMGKTSKCFDIDSLYRSFIETGNAHNPFTRERFPDSIIEEIEAYGVATDVGIQIPTGVNSSKKHITVPYYKKVGDLIIKIVEMSARVFKTSYVEFLRLNLTNNDSESVYSMNLEDSVTSLDKNTIDYEEYLDDDAMRAGLSRFIAYLKKNSGPEMSTNYMMHQAALEVLEPRAVLMGENFFQTVVRGSILGRRVANYYMSTFFDADFDGDTVSLFNPLLSSDDELPGLEETL